MFDVTPLLEPLQVRGKTFRNRIVMPPMVVNRGITTPEGIQWYGERAEAGVALVIVEATDIVDFIAELTPGNLRPLVQRIQQGGALAAIQLFPGRRGQSIAPSQLTRGQIENLIEQYRLATTICAEAGFDAVEPHGAHGFLLNQFFSPEKNQRTDDYGGTLEGRMRLALQIVEAIRPIADRAGMLILYRHTPVGPGYGIEESLVLAEALVDAGVDVLDISPASRQAPGDRAAPFMKLGVPVIAVNQMERLDRALEALNERRADLIAVGRGLIVDAQWPAKVLQGRFDEIVLCENCNHCFEDLRRGVPVTCQQWHD